MKLTAILAALALGVTALLGVTVLAASPAQATILTVDGGWQTFTYDGAGSSWDQTFTFTLTKAAVLNVTDFFDSGDQFSISGISAGTVATSLPASFGAYAGDPQTAFDDPAGNWSRGSYLLMAGIYTISGSALLSPFNAGEGAIELVSSSVSAVPLPAALPLFGAALSGLGLAGRRRRKQRSAV